MNNLDLEQFNLIQTEINILKNIGNINLVCILDYFSELNSFCVVSDYCDVSLQNLIADCKQNGNIFQEKKVIKIFVQLMRAMVDLHAHTLVHKNLKPS